MTKIMLTNAYLVVLSKLVKIRMTMKMIKMAKIMLTWVLVVLPKLVKIMTIMGMIKTAKIMLTW